ncbi:hypothetical protein NP233_g2504 [Leucocoprinus birnbaumii]|uniref:Uncharacterized protein n=1 Tax=Leucocoprinus birnbaumii TaxID=56174 RepID=A0AAD5W053_9AGAR|nr:hypothetical protein NP233_g2504 [Leucocoprinus birnbaumii]
MLLPHILEKLAYQKEDKPAQETHFDQIIFTSRLFNEHFRLGITQDDYRDWKRDWERRNTRYQHVDLDVDAPPASLARQNGPSTLSTFVETISSDDAASRILLKNGALDYLPEPVSLVLDLDVDYDRVGRIWEVVNSSLTPYDSEDFIQGIFNPWHMIFFSFSKSHSSNSIIPSIALQIADRYPCYKTVLTEVIANHLTIFSQRPKLQFRRLIYDPFPLFELSEANITICLHDIDQCRDEVLQQEIYEIIGEYTRSSRRLPLRWFVYGIGPKSLQSILSDPDWPIGRCFHHEPIVKEHSNFKTPFLSLKQEFALIRQKFTHLPEMHTAHWPPDKIVRDISTIAAENRGLVSFILHFVGDERANNPQGRLEYCMETVYNLVSAGKGNPNQLLDHFYRRLLSNIDPDQLSMSLRIIGFIIVFQYIQVGRSTEPIFISNFLGLSKTQFLLPLQELRPVLDIPYPHSHGADRPLLIHHSSFEDFIMDPRRSGKNCLRDGDVYYDVAARAFYWLGLPSSELLPKLSWNPLPEWDLDYYTDNKSAGDHLWLRHMAMDITRFSRNVIVKACLRTPESYIPQLIKQIRSLDYDEVTGPRWKPHLDYPHDISKSKVFARWLHRHDSENPWIAHVGT